MAGFTLSERETARLQEVVDACRVVDDEPIPWQVLEGLRDLLHTDDISLGGYCISPAHVWFMNGIDHTGRFVDEETPEEALSNPFWQRYWSSNCSYPDRTGDFDSVTTMSDFLSVRQLRARGRSGETSPYEREIMACIRLTPVRQLRILGWRATGSDFTDRDRFVLTLLRPHIQERYRRWQRLHPPSDALTERQLAVLSLVRDGFTNDQIGRRLDLAEGTVRTHLKHVFERLGVGSRTAAVTAVYGEPSPGEGASLVSR